MTDTQRVSGRSFVIVVPARVCRDCDALFLDGPCLERAELEVACELARTGPSDGESFRFMRKALAMRATDIASLIAVSPETISRWENGQRTVDRIAWITVGTMVLEKAKRATSTLERLMALRNPTIARAVRIDASEPPRVLVRVSSS
jgi:predicted transcriptional regulator